VAYALSDEMTLKVTDNQYGRLS